MTNMIKPDVHSSLPNIHHPENSFNGLLAVKDGGEYRADKESSYLLYIYDWFQVVGKPFMNEYILWHKLLELLLDSFLLWFVSSLINSWITASNTSQMGLEKCPLF